MKDLVSKTKDKTLLFVEDTEILRDSLSNLFTHFFDNIIIAENGKQGLELYHKHKDDIDLIITDLDMPIMNGDEMVTLIRENCKEIPIIISSARMDQSDLKHLATAFVEKPISLPNFISTLKSICKL